MRTKGGKTIRLNPVEDDHQVTDHPDRGRLEALMDQKLFLQRIKSERSAAYWFAASLWGITGLVLGALLGGFMMFQAYIGLGDPVRENLIAGAAMDEARDTVNSRPSLVDREVNPEERAP